MAQNENGEFELVLGNRQLLSFAAIVVILFAVFFTMGYIVGRNSVPFPMAGEAELQQAPQGLSGQARPPASAGALAEPEPPPAGEGPSSTQPAQPPPEPAPAPSEPAQQVPAQVPVAEGPEPGRTYLQVAAISRRDAEILVDTLRNKGFPALIGVGPNDLFRVLVGPYSDSGSLGKARADLEAAGFKNAFVPRL
jgi:cell division septation protein DedD